MCYLAWVHYQNNTFLGNHLYIRAHHLLIINFPYTTTPLASSAFIKMGRSQSTSQRSSCSTSSSQSSLGDSESSLDTVADLASAAHPFPLPSNALLSLNNTPSDPTFVGRLPMHNPSAPTHAAASPDNAPLSLGGTLSISPWFRHPTPPMPTRVEPAPPHTNPNEDRNARLRMIVNDWRALATIEVARRPILYDWRRILIGPNYYRVDIARVPYFRGFIGFQESTG